MANTELTLTVSETRADITKWHATQVTINVDALQCHIHYQKCLSDGTVSGSSKTVHTLSQIDLDSIMSIVLNSDKASTDPESAPDGTVT